MTIARSAPVLRGFVPAVVTPFGPQGELLLDAFEQILGWHLANGVDGICVAGDNGEAWSLSVDERTRLVEKAVEVVAGRVPVIAGASAVTARQSIVFADAAAVAGADALLVQPQPYVLKATTADIAGRFAAIAHAVPLPIVAYNSPRRTSLNMDVATLTAVCDVAPIVGLKEASRDFFHTTHIIERFGSRLAVMIGPAPFIVPGVALGASGFISSGPELLGRDAMRIVPLALEAPGAEMRALHYRLTTIYEALMQVGVWPASLKFALGLLGLPVGTTREPVGPLMPDAQARVRALLRQLDLVPETDALIPS